MKRGFFLFLLSFSVVFASTAENQPAKSPSQYCTEKGYKTGTLEFEFCCDRRKEIEKDEKAPSPKRILGRDKGGRFDKSRITDEALDLKPREPSDLSGVPIPQN
jgi:hypothetical protein